jgi:hypothetical protein
VDRSAKFDLATLLERLLLFERYTIRTSRCTEVETMVQHLGIVPTMQLIETDVVRVHDAPGTVGAYNMATSPHLTYDLRFVQLADSGRENVRGHVEALPLRGVSVKTARKFKDLLSEKALATVPSRLGRLDDTVNDLRDRRDLVRAAIEARLAQHGLTDVGPFHVEAKGISSESISVETDLGKRLGLPPEQLHEHVGKALIDIAKVNLELGFMEDLGAVGTGNAEQASVLALKLQSVAEGTGHVGSNRARVLEISGLPDIRTALANGSLDVHRFLRAIRSDEAREFRMWIRTADMMAEEELGKRLHVLRLKANSWQFKVVMLFAGLLLPALAGLGLSAADNFILSDLLNVPGPVLFLRRRIGGALRR